LAGTGAVQGWESPKTTDSERLPGLPQDAALKRPLVVSERSREVLVAPGASGVAVVCFTGGLNQLGIQLALFDRYLAEHDLTAVYLRDFSWRFYVHGVRALGAGHEQTVGGLRRLLDGLGARTVHTLGCSAGGFAALSYGLDLGARKMLSFSGASSYSRTHCSPEMLEVDHRMPTMADYFQTVPDVERLDMRMRLTSRPMNGEVHLYYGKHMPQDRAHARHLDGLAGVRLHPVGRYQGHNTIARLAETGKLRGILARLLAPAP
jgi:pimeloyl-ACP methyl ester carboxylesterase